MECNDYWYYFSLNICISLCEILCNYKYRWTGKEIYRPADKQTFPLKTNFLAIKFYLELCMFDLDCHKMLHISDQKSLRIMFDLKLKLPLYKKDIKLNLTFYNHLTLTLVNDLSKGKIVLIMQQCFFYLEIQKTIKTFSNAYVPVKLSRFKNVEVHVNM